MYLLLERKALNDAVKARKREKSTGSYVIGTCQSHEDAFGAKRNQMVRSWDLKTHSKAEVC